MKTRKHATLKVFPEANEQKIKQTKDGWQVHTKAPRENGRANKAALHMLRTKINGDVRIVSGHRSQHKIIEITN